jgi:hypothetical protein
MTPVLSGDGVLRIAYSWNKLSCHLAIPFWPFVELISPFNGIRHLRRVKFRELRRILHTAEFSIYEEPHLPPVKFVKGTTRVTSIQCKTSINLPSALVCF